jgi:hypothetical protein
MYIRDNFVGVNGQSPYFSGICAGDEIMLRFIIMGRKVISI